MICFNDNKIHTSISRLNERYKNRRITNIVRHEQNLKRKMQKLKRQLFLVNVKLLKYAITNFIKKKNNFQIETIKSNKRNLKHRLENVQKELNENYASIALG